MNVVTASVENGKSGSGGEFHMINKQKTKSEPSKSQITTATLNQKAESEQVDVFNRINRLQVLLRRFAPFVASESVQIVTQTQATLKTASIKLSRFMDFHNVQNNRDRLENWENEGESIEHVSV
jgi:hypothetical protein